MIDIIWWAAARGNWDEGLLSETFNKYPEIFIQHNVHEPPKLSRAIVIVVGKPPVGRLRQYLDTLKSGVVILTSDEDAYFDWKAAVPPHLEIWTQYWNPEYKGEIKERILLGVPNRFKDYKIDTAQPKKYLWSFVGQVQNEFRQKCVDVLKTLPDGYLKVTSMFGGYCEDGMEYSEYLNIMAQSRFIVAPSGSMVADSFRVYEGLELGATVIADIRCPRDAENYNYWNEVYPDNGLIQISDWSMLPEVIAKNHKTDNGWWFDYKQELEQKLLKLAQ